MRYKIGALPSFLILGAQKGGTSSLSYYLSQHKNVYVPKMKEVNFFNSHFYNNLGIYKRNFKPSISDRIQGEATPEYITLPLYLNRIKETLPNIKLILLLRNPVERAISHYKDTLRKGRESYSLKEALEYEEIRIQKPLLNQDLNHRNKDVFRNYALYAYKDKGLYYNQVEHLFNLFNKENILILQSEKLFSNPKEIYCKCTDFLKIKDNVNDINFDIINQGTSDPEGFSDERKVLYSFYKKSNSQLFDLLNERFDW